MVLLYFVFCAIFRKDRKMSELKRFLHDSKLKELEKDQNHNMADEVANDEGLVLTAHQNNEKEDIKDLGGRQVVAARLVSIKKSHSYHGGGYQKKAKNLSV